MPPTTTNIDTAPDTRRTLSLQTQGQVDADARDATNRKHTTFLAAAAFFDFTKAALFRGSKSEVQRTEYLADQP